MISGAPDAQSADIAPPPPAGPPVERLIPMVRSIAVSGLAGLITGLVVGGVGGRLVMRFSAMAARRESQGRLTENGNRVGDITFGGTLGLVIVVAIFFGAIGAVIWVLAEPWLRRAGAAGSTLYGALLLGLGGTTVLDAENRDFDILDPDWLNVTMFVLMFFVYAFAFVAINTRLQRRLSGHAWRNSTQMLIFGPLAMLGFPFAFLTFTLLLSPSICDGPCQHHPWPAGIAFAIMALATMATRIIELRGGPTNPKVTALGMASMSIAIAVGIAITLRAAVAIV